MTIEDGHLQKYLRINCSLAVMVFAFQDDFVNKKLSPHQHDGKNNKTKCLFLTTECNNKITEDL